MKRTSDFFSIKESNRKIRLLVSASSIPSVKRSFQINNQNPSSIVLNSLHCSRWDLGNWACADEDSQSVFSLPVLVVPLEKIRFHSFFFRLVLKLGKLFDPWWNQPTPSSPLLVDKKLDCCSNRSERDSLDRWMEESEDNHPLSLAMSQTS